MNGEWIPSLWWLIDFQKLIISFVAKRPWMHQITNLYFREVVRLGEVLKSITSNQDSKLLSHFWRILRKKFGTRLWYNTSYHPQIERQTEVADRSLGDLLRCLVGENPKKWEVVVAQVEFAYNYSNNQTRGKSLFEVVYGKQPTHPYDLAPLLEMGGNSLKGEDMVDLMKKLHEEIRLKIKESNVKYKKYANQKRISQSLLEGDMVMVYVHKEGFLASSYLKLRKRKMGPYIKKIAKNAC